MKTAACRIVAMTKTTNRGSGAVMMNCVPSSPAANPTMVFASPPIPRTPRDKRVLDQPGQRADQHTRDRPRHERNVDDDHQDEVQRRRAANHQTGEGRLQRQRGGNGRQRGQRLHSFTRALNGAQASPEPGARPRPDSIAARPAAFDCLRAADCRGRRSIAAAAGARGRLRARGVWLTRRAAGIRLPRLDAAALGRRGAQRPALLARFGVRPP